MNHPLEINQGDTLRLYIVNEGITIPVSIHLHSSIFDVYPSGLLSNEPYQVSQFQQLLVMQQL